jgi:hypothetical protein
LRDPPTQLVGLSFHSDELTEQQRAFGFAGSPRGRQSAAASEIFCIICDDKINLVHDFHSRYLDLRTYIEAKEEEQAIRFLSSNSHRWPMGRQAEDWLFRKSSVLGLCYLASWKIIPTVCRWPERTRLTP